MQAVERLDVSPLARYVAHLSRWYLEQRRATRTSATSTQAAAGARAPRGLGTGGGAMRTLLVDNHDSYTYNVFHLLAGVAGEEPIVIDNDAVSWRALSRWDFDAIVLSPGRGRRGAGTTSASATTSSATARSRCSASASATRAWATCSKAR